MKKLIIAIDGPAGSGKSSIGDMLAERLGYAHISTGSIYRAIGWKAHQCGISLADVPALVHLIEETTIEFRRNADGSLAVVLDGNDVSHAITTNEAGMFASTVAAIPEVRTGLLSLQRQAGKNGGVILDGRDIGTVVFPDADAKFYLDASAEARAKRRFLQLQEQGREANLEQLIHDIKKRDFDDSNRAVAPLRKADDAMPIDSTNMSREEVVNTMQEYIDRLSDRAAS
ncbi:cytidylate kinase [Candidatus Moduliflexus flocculans]|uniref:Cytidylate kinase n=1 Tax=Candidatus Moduliflexus flocculans TaxID=1499966 RepID=A0A0S6W0J0_9BACT|nr:cytidylate kinase [Candidatus Moduliflexus flocculans]